MTGLVVEVDQFAFTGRGAESEDRYDMGQDDRDTVREAMRFLWESFCGEEWEARRRAHDAGLSPLASVAA